MSESETQTQSETQIQEKTQEIEPQELTTQQIKKLVELAEKEGRLESRYLLKLETWVRQGSSFDDKADFDVVYGEAAVIELEEWDEGYPHRRGTRYLIVPKTVPVIILWRNKWDYETDIGEREIVYVFTSEGWKKILVRSSRRS
jgi:hypothetical protein